jgi:hypothetical protein
VLFRSVQSKHARAAARFSREDSASGQDSTGASSCSNKAITEERLNQWAVLVLLALAGVLTYTTFEWGGGANRPIRIPPSPRIAGSGVELRLFTDEWSPLPVRWAIVLLQESLPRSTYSSAESMMLLSGSRKPVSNGCTGCIRNRALTNAT